MITAPSPGVYSVSAEIYHQWDAVNQSLLTTVAQQGPKQARYEQLHPRDPTPNMVLGDQAHTFVLEEAEINKRFAKVLDLPKTSAAAKAEHKKHEAKHKGKDFLKLDRIEKLQGMRNEMHHQPDFAQLWERRKGVELCIVWVDKETGLLCKARLDLIAPFAGMMIVLDYKTSANAREYKFAASIYTFGYDIQGAHYLAAADSIETGPQRKFVLAAQETKPVYNCMLHPLGEASLESGRIRRRDALLTWAECLHTDTFPGYPTGLNDVEMPSYAMHLFSEFA